MKLGFINGLFGVALHERSVGKLLSRMGLIDQAAGSRSRRFGPGEPASPVSRIMPMHATAGSGRV